MKPDIAILGAFGPITHDFLFFFCSLVVVKYIFFFLAKIQ